MALSESEELELLELEKAKALSSSKAEIAPSELESFGRGAAQGATLGFRDELAGAIKSPSGAAKKAAAYFGYDAGSDKDIEEYLKERDASRLLDESAQKSNPKSFLGGNLTGSLATLAVPGLGATKGATALNALKAGGLGATMATGSSKAEDTEGLAKDAALGAGIGAGGSIVAEKVISPALSYGADKAKTGFQKLSDALKDKAENLAENATGATRVQAEKFAPNAGRELLDKKLVRFLDAPKNIADRTDQLMTKSEGVMDDVLSSLDAKGVKVSPDKVLGEFDSRIARLSSDPSTAPQARALETIKEDVANALGNDDKALSVLEKWKRGYKKVNWQDPDAALARKEAYRSLMKSVEGGATEADPNLADKFIAAKKDYGLAAPIQEAAEKRAAQLNQHPILGLNDIATAGASSAVGGPIAALPGIAARRALAPRISSSAAVTMDKLGSLAGMVAKNSPPISPAAASAVNRAVPLQAARQFPQEIFKQVAGGKSAPEISSKDRGPQSQQIDRARTLQRIVGTPYEAPLKAAAERGESSFAATYYLMSQQDPEFRMKMEDKTNER